MHSTQSSNLHNILTKVLTVKTCPAVKGIVLAAISWGSSEVIIWYGRCCVCVVRGYWDV